jgi:hypothetical protein
MLSYIIDIDAAKPFSGEKPERATANSPRALTDAADIHAVGVDKPNENRFVSGIVRRLKFDRPTAARLKEIIDLANSRALSKDKIALRRAMVLPCLDFRYGRASHKARSNA